MNGRCALHKGGPAPEPFGQIRATPTDSILSRLANPGLILPTHHRKGSMKHTVTRRDFLNGAALALAPGATLSPRDLLALEGVPNRRLLFLRDDSPVQICNLGSFGIRPGLPTLLKKIERFFDPWRQNANRLEGSDHSSTHIDQIALLLA